MQAIRHTAVIVVVIALLGVGKAGMAVEKRYLAYETYRALIALCPEVKNSRLLGLQPAAADLWKVGQLQLPEETNVFRGDFNHDGRSDMAIVISDGATNYLLIAEETTKGWKRTGLVKVKEGISEWNGRALCVGDSSFVAWDGRKYRFERGPLARYCNGYDSSDFRGVTIKCTYVGPQDKPYPGLLISSFYHWPSLESFKSHRKAGIFYGNDDSGVMWHLTLSPEALREFAIALNRSSFLAVAEDRNGTETVSHSLSILDTRSSNRSNYYEIFLIGKETVGLLDAFAGRIEQENAAGAKVLRKYAKMFGS